MIVVSPDVGGVVRARAVAKRLDSDLAIIDKRRPRPNVATVMNIIGDVEGRTCVIMDDLVDTANTLCEAAGALKDNGAERVVAYCTHPVLSGRAVERVEASKLDQLVVTDTIPLRDDARRCKPHPLRVGRRAHGGDDASHQQRGFGQLALHGVRGDRLFCTRRLVAAGGSAQT